MSREMKFRVWDKVDYMGNPFTLQDLLNRKIEFTSDCPIMQFTGIRDFQNTELFEGDIVEFESVFALGSIEESGVIVFNPQHGGFVINIERHGKKYYRKFNIDYSDGEIFADQMIKKIGNIYENPDLLK